MRAPPPGRIELPPANIKEITTSVYERLESLGISAPELMPRGPFVSFACTGILVFWPGHIEKKHGRPRAGKPGVEASEEPKAHF
jgi:hypothetical protein